MLPITLLFVMLLYFGVLLLVGQLTSRQESNKAFFIGSHQSPWWLVAIGMVGSSISGVSLVSVPGMPRTLDFTYMQTVLGFFAGYVVIIYVLLPLYYRLNLTSIYGYLQKRYGQQAYVTGALFFLLSKSTGAAARLYLAVLILQQLVFDHWHIPFAVTSSIFILLIWLYSHRSGIKTIVWTDALQTVVLLIAMALVTREVIQLLEGSLGEIAARVWENPHTRIFVWDDPYSSQYFFKQFIGGMLITLVMTGLDQDMMQKNLSCRSVGEAQKNMRWYSVAFIPINLFFLVLGVLLLLVAQQEGISLPAGNDEILPYLVTSLLGGATLLFFTIGIIAAAFSSADSAMTALTTSVCIDLMDIRRLPERRAEKTRRYVHIGVSFFMVLLMIAINQFKNESIIHVIYTLASYTYGPLLGLFTFGLLTRRHVSPGATPYIAIASPLLCLLTHWAVDKYTAYQVSYELLLVNALFTVGGLYVCSKSEKKKAVMDNSK